MAPDIAPVVAPVIRSSPDVSESKGDGLVEYRHDSAIVVRVLGWFESGRIAEFEQIVGRMPEVQLLSVDGEHATATLRIASESPMFRNATKEQILERLSQRLQSDSTGRLSLRALGTMPDTQLQRIEIGVVGLDCAACSMALHDILVQSPGVVHATASFRSGTAVAWVEPGRSDRAALEAILKQRGVTLRTAASEPAASP